MKNDFFMDNPIMAFLNKLTNLVILNLSFLISCIPVITIGAALTALYSVNLRMAKGEESYVFRSYWKAFKCNFRQATSCWCIMILFLSVLAADVWATGLLSGTFSVFFKGIMLVFCVIYVVIFLYVFPYISWFDDKLSVCLKNSFLIGGSNIGYTVALVLITSAALGVAVFDFEIMLRLLIVWIIFGIALLNYAQSKILRIVFSKYEISGN